MRPCPQVYLDNRKSAAERALEAPVKTAELLIARGVKVVVTTSMVTTAAFNTALLQVRTLRGSTTNHASCTAAYTPWMVYMHACVCVVCLVVQAILQGLASGLTVAEAAWKANAAVSQSAELEHQRCSLLVLGAPNLAATTSGVKGGKPAAGAKKK